MGMLAERLKRAPPLLWVNGHAYGARLLANDRAPWLDTAGFVAWQGKLLGLLKPDVAELPLAAIVAAWLDTHAGLREAMSAKRRAVFPLRTLLADESLRSDLVDLAKALRAAVRLPLVLVMPSPRAWVGVAYQQAHGDATDVGDDEADSAAVYLADFLRNFGDAGIDGLLLEEATDNPPGSAESLALYQPVLNVAAHYQWDVGLRLPQVSNFQGVVDGFAWVIALQPLLGAPHGMPADAGFWSGADAAECAAGGFRYVEIPANASPEHVLERLALLR